MTCIWREDQLTRSCHELVNIAGTFEPELFLSLTTGDESDENTYAMKTIHYMVIDILCPYYVVLYAMSNSYKIHSPLCCYIELLIVPDSKSIQS